MSDSAPSPRPASSHASSTLAALDAQAFSWFHAKAVLTTGMGVFTDGYDLVSISIVLPMVLHSLGVAKLTGFQSSLLVSAALIGSAAGAVLFGVLSNRGRKRFYGLDVGLMAVAAAAQAFTGSVWQLIAVRFLLGIGVGADYVLSPMIMAEHSNAADRGKALTVGFSLMWVLGGGAAALLQMLLAGLHVSPDLQWRLTLALGLVPAISVLILRRRLPETPRYHAHLTGNEAAVREVLAEVRGDHAATAKATAPAALDVPAHGGLMPGLRDYFAAHWRTFAMVCLLWFLYDIVIYAAGLFGPSLLARGLGLTPAQFQAISLLGFSVLGSLMAVVLVDRWGRKPLQAWGFVLMGVMLGLYALTYHAGVEPAIYGMALYGLFIFFNQAGPGSISGAGMLGVEMAATRVRGLVQGLSVTAGRLGAALGVFVFPALFAARGQGFAVGFLCVTALLGALCTAFGIHESRRRSLEQSSRQDQLGPGQAARRDAAMDAASAQ